MPDAKEVTEIIKHIRDAGYRVAKTGNSKHYKVLKRTGAAVIDENGPLIISSTPSEHRFREMTVKRLMAAGVLTKDPWKATGSGAPEKEPTTKRRRGPGGLGSPEAQAAKLAGIQARSKRLREQTGGLRARLEPIAAKLGGWSQGTSGVGIAEFARVAQHWAENRGRVEFPRTDQKGNPTSAQAVTQAARNLVTPGGTLGERWLPFFEVFIDELERDAGTPPDPAEAAMRYQELLREQKGISPGPSSPAALPPPVAAPAPVQRAEVGPRYSDRPTSLAFRVMYWLGKTDISQQEASEIVAEIAEMEITR